MKLLFLRPLLEKYLNRWTGDDMLERYMLNTDNFNKINDTTYEIKDIASCLTEMIEVYNALGCLPMVVCETDEQIKSVETAIFKTCSSINGSDILWIEPSTRVLNGKRVLDTLYNVVSNKVILGNGKSFLRATTLDEFSLCTSHKTDYYLLRALHKSLTYEELGTTCEIKNQFNTILNVIDYMQDITFELVLKYLYGYSIPEQYKWVCLKIGDYLSVHSNGESIIETLKKVHRDKDQVLSIEPKMYGLDSLKKGLWKTEDGFLMRVNSNQSIVKYVGDLDSTDLTIVKFYKE